MEDSGATPESSKAGTKSAAAAARKVKAKQTRALDILKRDTGIVESNRPSRVGIIQDVSGTSSLAHLRTSLFPSCKRKWICVETNFTMSILAHLLGNESTMKLFLAKVIFVCNAGLTTSTTNSDLVRIFSKVLFPNLANSQLAIPSLVLLSEC